MLNYNIASVSEELTEQLQKKIDFKTKPLGSLGKLESIALQIGKIQNSLTPTLNHPAIVVFAGDHGVTEEGVSPFPQEVTFQMVMNFLGGGAAINVFSRQNGIKLKVVDAGVNYDFGQVDQLIDAKIAKGTFNFTKGPAMTVESCSKAIASGAQIVEQLHNEGTNIIGFGEMGIGNTTSASALLCALCDVKPSEASGRGTGLDLDGVNRKINAIEKAFQLNGNHKSPLATLATYGGFEIAMIVGGMLKAAELKMVIMVDGFIVTSALLAASAICEKVLDYCVFGHQSNENAHKLMLEKLDANPILDIDMRLGEGTGAAVAYPIIKSAVSFLAEMSSFEDAGVSTAE